LWNVKRIRPVELGPFNYDEENYTSLLWVMEGFTSYYEKLILMREGIYTPEKFLASMFSSLNYIEGSVGARVQPVSHASFDAWIKAYRPNENSSNTTMSYYSGGSIKAMMLDIMIIEKYNGEKCLDDFMRVLYQKYYKEKNRGFSETEFKDELANFLGQNMDEFYHKYIDGTEIPDYKALFAKVGLDVKYAGQPLPSIGIGMKDSGGKTIVTSVRSGSAAEEAGISVNDEIIGCNGIRADKASLESYFSNLRTGEIIDLLFAREDQLFSTEVKVTTYEQPRFDYEISKATTKNKLYNYWLRIN
jgi:predicted metalloprotease with PDZ domain